MGKAGLFEGGGFEQLGVQAAAVVLTFITVFVLSLAVLAAIKATVGLRVSPEEEEAGLDIAEHGMYGYPEQFIPAPELVGFSASPRARARPAGAHHHGGPRVMKKVEAFIRHEAFEPIRMELLTLGFPSLSIMEVKGSGRQKGITERYRGAELTNYLRPEGQDRVRGRLARRADGGRHHPQARPDGLDRRRQGLRPAGRRGVPHPHR